MDKDGQELWSAEEARVALDRWRASGLTLAEYCRRRGLRAKRLSRWRQRLGWEAEGEADGFSGPGASCPRSRTGVREEAWPASLTRTASEGGRGGLFGRGRGLCVAGRAPDPGSRSPRAPDPG